MKVNTYGIQGLTEWHGTLQAGTLQLKISFKGGTASPSGALPAYHMTKNPIAQFIIEHSKEFSSGLISLISSQEIPGQHPNIATPKNTTHTTENQQQSIDTTPVPTTHTSIPVHDKSQAIQYLKQHYPNNGYTAVKLRSDEAFNAACEECGITFIIEN